MTILIVGATGRLGRPVAKALLEAGHSVRALVRDRAKADDLRQLGAELVLGDLTDVRSLELACKGAGRVFACAHSLLGRGERSSAQVDHVGHSALVVAARAAKVEHFVYTSMLGARADHPIDFARTKHEIEQVVKGSGMGWTILRPSAFMECHVHEFNGKMLLDKGFVVLLGRANKPRNYVAVRDVVPFAVQALATDDLAGRTLEIGGPDNLSNTEVAHLYVARSRQGRVFHLPAGVARAIATAVRPLHEGVARIIDLSLLDERQMREEWYPNKLLDEFPRVLTGVEAFIGERVAEWRRSRPRR
ncbi:MAG TPA: SDR family oxidoreductase [Burkholderiaceae bacterium]|nr:SDR family oxidoreductase [Burkholderiaceae bacterium]